MNEHDDILERVARTLREPVTLDAGLDERVMTAIGTLAGPDHPRSPVKRGIDWLLETRTVRLNPLGGLALAAGFAALIFVGSQQFTGSAEPAEVTDAAGVATIQFVLVAPDAESVALVGDFNDWNVSATMLSEDRDQGVWSVTVPLEPGRYRYSFLVDGSTWMTDPQAALAVADEFGRPNSVLTIGEL